MKRFYCVAILLLLGSALLSCGAGSDDETAAAVGPEGEWVLDSLVVDGASIALPTDRPVDFRVAGSEADGTEVGGSAGCNSLGGTASFNDDGSATFTELFWTAMACAEPSLMDFEAPYTQSLSSVDGWQLAGKRLVLRGPGVEMTYTSRVAPPDLPIVGTSWTLDTFFDGESASNQPGMDAVTISFSDTGVSTSGRCWSIGGFATVEPGGEGNVSVDFTTADPDFTCDDRGFFNEMMNRLAGTTEYSIDEQRLTLGDTSGPIMGFSSAG